MTLQPPSHEAATAIGGHKVPPLPALKPPTTLLMGPVGAGKTTAIATYAKAGLKTFVLFTDPGGEESFLAALERLEVPIENVHWNYITPMSQNWDEMKQAAINVGLLSYKALTEIKSSGKKAETQFYAIINLLANFKCARTGEEFGPVDKFGPDCAFILDSLSGLNTITMDMMQGTKPIAHEGEYGVAMNMEEKLVQKLVCDTKCFICCTGHVERIIDPITGLRTTSIVLIGKKLASTGKIARLFSDIVLAVRDNEKFFWSTKDSSVDLKHRLLPLGDKLEPSFEQIVERYKQLAKQAQAK